MGSQALPAAPPSIDNISCVSITRTNAHPFSLDTNRPNNRNPSITTTTDNNNNNNNNSVGQPRTKYLVRYTRYSWNPYHGLQMEDAVNSPEYSSRGPSGALPRQGGVTRTRGVESADQRSPAPRVHPLPGTQVGANGGDASSGSTPKSAMLEEMLRDFRERLRHPRPAMHCL